MRQSILLSCAVAALSYSPIASAALVANVIEIANNRVGDAVPDYSSAVLANDPLLGTNYARTFDVVVTATGSERWASCDLQINASPQSIYFKAGSSGTNPAPSAWAAQPAAQFSSFICVPTFGAMGLPNADPNGGGSVLGMAQFPFESGMGPAVITPAKIDVAWGDVTASANSGTFTIARITLLDSWGGGITFAGRVGATNNSVSPPAFSFTTQAIPEPTTFGLAAMALPFLGKRRSRMS